MSKSSVKTFLITGVNSGLGRAFAEGALAADHRVIGTIRRQEDADVFSAVSPDSAFPLLLDVTNYDNPLKSGPYEIGEALRVIIE